MDYLYYKAINWDEQEDQVDQATWLKLTNNFWLDTRVPITDDQPSWHALTAQQQAQVGHALAGRALLSAFQSELGAPSLRAGRRTQQEEAVLNLITFMESVHTKAVTTIFRRLTDEETTAAYYAWADGQAPLQAALTDLTKGIEGDDLMRRGLFLIADTVLCAGFDWAVLTQPALAQTNQMLKNILTGNLIFRDYLAYKFRQGIAELPLAKQEALVAQLTKGAQSLIKLAHQQNEALLEDAGAANDLVDFQWRMLLVALGLGEQPAESGPVAHQIDQLANQAQETVVVETIKDADATEFMSDDDYDF